MSISQPLYWNVLRNPPGCSPDRGHDPTYWNSPMALACMETDQKALSYGLARSITLSASADQLTGNLMGGGADGNPEATILKLPRSFGDCCRAVARRSLQGWGARVCKIGAVKPASRKVVSRRSK